MPTSIPVFCYHNVCEAGGHPPRLFEEHLAAIRDAGFRTITAHELVAGMSGRARLPKKVCVLTFDDCHLSCWTMAAPLLAKYGMTGVFFCVTDFIHEHPGKRPQLPPEAGGPELLTAPDSFRNFLENGDTSQFMTPDELRAMIDDFGFEVHGHTARHQGCFRSLTQVARLGDSYAHWSSWGIYPPEMRAAAGAAELPLFEATSAYAYNGYWPVRGGMEAGGGIFYRRRTDAERHEFCLTDLRRCMARIREVNGLGDEQYLCWPWGQYDELATDCARQAGFRAAFSLERSANSAGGDVMRIHRIGVGKLKTGDWVQSRLRMYSGKWRARLFFKFLRKRPEVKSVLFMTDSDKLSGGSRQMLNSILGMRESGLRVTVAAPADCELSRAVAPLCAGANPVELVPFDDFRQYVRAAAFVRRLATRVEAEVVHTFHAKAYKSAAIAKLLGARFRLFINRGVIFPPNTIFALYALLAEGVTCNSAACAEVLRRYMVPASRLRLVYNSLLPEGRRDEDGLPPERAPRKKRGVRVLYVGNFAPAKGYDVFAAMAGELARRGVRDVEYAACGVRLDEPWRDVTPPEVRSRLSMLGPQPHERVQEEMLAADILVTPSRQESMPNVVLEAFACSLPVVCTAVGGMPELVREGVNGFLRPSEDVSGLADAVAALAADPALRLRMGRINRRIAAQCLGNAAKTLTLLRVYFGARAQEPLPIEALARRLADQEAADDGAEHREEPCRP